MGRIEAVKYMVPEQMAMVDACIRKHYYSKFTEAAEALSKQGIEISRSALHRRAQKLRAIDAAHTATPHDTIVIVMERSTGGVTSVATSASRDAVLAAIERLRQPE